MNWKKSSYSGGQGGNCVETAATDGAVHVRDTANRAGATLHLPPSAWGHFTGALKA